MENPEFLKDKYDLHNAPEVEQATKRLDFELAAILRDEIKTLSKKLNPRGYRVLN